MKREKAGNEGNEYQLVDGRNMTFTSRIDDATLLRYRLTQNEATKSRQLGHRSRSISTFATPSGW
jgi:hypothetical protein